MSEPQPSTPAADTPATPSDPAPTPKTSTNIPEMTAHVLIDNTATSPNPFEDGHATTAPIEPAANAAPQPTAATPITSPAPPSQPETPVDPQIASLAAIFPTFDHELMKDILNQCNGNEEQAIDVLLGMTDPSHVPSAPVSNQSQAQTDLDAQLAERLMLEEEDAAAREYEAYSSHGRGRQQQQGQRTDVPYMPRQRAPRRSSEGARNDPLQDQFRDFISPRQDGDRNTSATSPGGGRGGGGGINTAELQEQFNKFADTGKKTFSNIMGKVRAKLAAIDQPASNSQQPPISAEQQAYAPWNQPQSAPVPASAPSPPAPQTWSSPAPSSNGGYDIPAPRPMPYPSPAGEPASTPAPTSSLMAPSTSRQSTTPPAAVGVDRSKLGLLPKRPVSMTSPRASAEIPRPSEPEEDEIDDLYDDPASQPKPSKPSTA
ncbi:hypothetical protein DL93DRAFT_2072093 [Clavulina sp. PMI_390]|nr:hypothetical protein DL93DRAFT_2072093 [Clavulina sp. PMI_390]